jgi:REP element-mobilizing transposase RayT
MARKLRVQYPGALYHVMNHGSSRAPIFIDDRDRRFFLETLGQACVKTGWQVHAFCLMPDHFHLVVETPRPNLVVGMKWFLGAYTGRFNRRHKLFGHLFSGRYKSLIVDGAHNGYLKTVCDYVHLNPARANRIGRRQKLASYAWSSYPDYLTSARNRPPWLRADRLLGQYGIPRDSATGRRRFADAMEAQRKGEESQEFKAVRRGWCLGGKAFRKKLLGQMRKRRGPNHHGRERFESDQEKALRIVRVELKRLGWTDRELRKRRKGDKNKVEVARRLRRETTMTLQWIAERLAMGRWGSVFNLLAADRGTKR